MYRGDMLLPSRRAHHQSVRVQERLCRLCISNVEGTTRRRRRTESTVQGTTTSTSSKTDEYAAYAAYCLLLMDHHSISGRRSRSILLLTQ